MYRAKSVDNYVNRHPDWKAELTVLRELLRTTELEECIKWGAPCYTFNGENIIGLMGFKNYVGLWFHQGVFLKDQQNVLVNAQEGKTKALRQWRFSSMEDIEPEIVRAYLQEAVTNAKAGRKIVPEKTKALEMPSELLQALKNDPTAAEKFQGLRPGLQKEFATHISDAKRDDTKARRLEKILPMIKSGIGLNDKYR